MRFGCEAKSTHIRSFCLAYRSAIDQSHLSILVTLPDFETCRDLTDRLPEKALPLFTGLGLLQGRYISQLALRLTAHYTRAFVRVLGSEELNYLSFSTTPWLKRLTPLGVAAYLSHFIRYLLSPDFVNLEVGRIRLSKAKAPVVADASKYSLHVASPD
jgi:hypothetical protein